MIAFLTRHLERIAHRMSFFDPFFSWYYRPLVKEETRMARFTQHDHILVIGGGSMPYSAYYLARMTHARMTVLDCDPTAVRRGQVFLKRKHATRIQYLEGCALAIELTPYSAIHVAKQVSPKSLVVERLLKEAPAGTKILLRQPPNNVPHHALTLRYEASFSLVKALCYFVV